MKTVKISDYKEYQTIITYVKTYNGVKALKPGDIADDKDFSLSMFIHNKPGKKLSPKAIVKDNATVYEYTTGKDRLKGTVSRYAINDHIVSTGKAESLKGFLKDLADRQLRGELTQAQVTKAVMDKMDSLTAIA
jgi:hypothetical protein